MSKAHNKIAGFTMLEMIMVLIIASVVLIIVAPRWRNFLTRWDLETDVRKMVGKIRETQQKAIRDNTDYRIVWDTDNTLYTIEKDDGGGWGEAEVVDFTIDEFDFFVTGFTDDTVVFDHFGAAGNCPSNECVIQLQKDSQTEFVVISSVTGRVRAL